MTPVLYRCAHKVLRAGLPAEKPEPEAGTRRTSGGVLGITTCGSEGEEAWAEGEIGPGQNLKESPN